MKIYIIHTCYVGATTYSPHDIVDLAANIAIPLIDQGYASVYGGEGGSGTYTYVAWASDNQGTGFSLTPATGLTWVAILVTADFIANPVASDFAGLWANYKGDPGTNGTNGDSAGLKYTIYSANIGARLIMVPSLNATTILISAYDYSNIVHDLSIWGTSTNTVKGLLYINSNTTSDSSSMMFEVTAVTYNSAMERYNLAVQNGSGSSFTNGEVVVLTFAPSGDKGLSTIITEQMTGEVNGVNTIYFTSEDIGTIISVTLNGLQEHNHLKTGVRQITMGSAPLNNGFADYLEITYLKN